MEKISEQQDKMTINELLKLHAMGMITIVDNGHVFAICSEEKAEKLEKARCSE